MFSHGAIAPDRPPEHLTCTHCTQSSRGQHLRVHQHFAAFQSILGQAERLRGAHDYAGAAVYAQIAADYAWCNHPGLFVSPRLERILMAIGQETNYLAPYPPDRPYPAADPKHILHVVTQAYGVGGHTRLVWRWIQQDCRRSHSVVLTQQGPYDVPLLLQRAVDTARGRIHVLDSEAQDLPGRARALRHYARYADQIVLHIHPFDVVPSIAFADRAGFPPILFLNHADHVFWVGAETGDLFVHLRESGMRLSTRRRGIPTTRQALLPTPIDHGTRHLSRRDAKQCLGIADDAVLILSIALAYKYAPIDGVSIADVFAPILDEYRNAIFVLFGPSQGHLRQWVGGDNQIPERMLALGERDDTALYYQAADIYIDSFPFASITSLLEAGSYGTPLVSYCPHAPASEVLCADAPGLEAGLIRVHSVAELRAAVSRLITNARLRAEAGDRISTGVLATHGPDKWPCSLDNIYRQAAGMDRTTDHTARARPGPADDLDTDLFDRLQVQGHWQQGFDAAVRRHIRLLPIGPRVRVWIEMFCRNPALSPGLLLSNRLGTLLTKCQRQSRKFRLSRRLILRWATRRRE